MPTIVTHAVVAAGLITAFPAEKVPRRLAIVGAVCSIVPDFDVAGFRFGIHYADFLGHRGFTHSLLFAALLAAMAMFAGPRSHRGLVWFYLFLATASHGIFDALTDGRLGVALLSPFDLTRYFLPVTPISVSPIGAGFFSRRGVSTLMSEALWVWLPCLVFVVAMWLMRRGARERCQVPNDGPNTTYKKSQPIQRRAGE